MNIRVMKKGAGVILALILALSACAVSFAEETEEIPGTLEVSYAGFRFVPPEVYRNTIGVVTSHVYDAAEHIFETIWDYNALPQDIVEKIYDKTNRGVTIPEGAIMNTLFELVSIGRGMTLERYSQISGYSFAGEKVYELGKVGETTFYLVMNEPNEYFIEDVDPTYREEYIALASAVEEVKTAFTFFEPTEKPDPNAGLVGRKIEFTTTDLDGNPVSSADLFAQNKVTMLNIWATWCGPCIGELEDLQSIYRNQQKKGVGVVGMMTDDDVATARELLDEYHVTYPVILAPANLDEVISLEGWPTTVFVGPDGTVLAEPVEGALVERYHTLLNQLLRK